MITAVTIENFKGISDPVRIELKPITMLFGSNSAGKSTVFHALLVAYEAVINRNFNPDRTTLGGNSVDLGGFQNFVHGHDTNSRVSIEFECDLSNESFQDEHPINESDSLEILETNISGFLDDVWSMSLKIEIGHPDTDKQKPEKSLNRL